jgi:hypothetical protein
MECLVGMNFIIILWLLRESVVENQEAIIKRSIEEIKKTT